MSGPSVIVDTGPLVAYLVKGDQFHRWAVAKFDELDAPFMTCEAVLTETCFLLARFPGAVQRFFELLDSGLLVVDFAVLDQRTALGKLMKKYEDLPMALADACLVRLAELHSGAVVFTVDSHFRTYRKNGRQPIPVIMPDGR